MLGRVQDPTPLLAGNWAEREQTLAELGSAGTWATYGADPNQFNAIEQSLSSLHLTVLDSTNSNYVTSAQSRTIWVELNSADDFNKLFNSTLQQYTDPHIRTKTSFSGTAVFRCPRAGMSRACGSIPRAFRWRPTSRRALR